MDDQTTHDFIRTQAALAGRYSLQRELGRGGMGVVYLAQEVALERPVALKVLQPHLAMQPALKQRFLNEARTAAKLSHPNILPIFSVDDIDDIVFFVMAFVDGETLGERIRIRGPLPASELARILRDVGWGLAYAHAQGVVHRDVKADNIMIERGSGRALVVDFGIARATSNAGVTSIGEILGTADYMSPEQASGEVVDHRSDIYSLGVVALTLSRADCRSRARQFAPCWRSKLRSHRHWLPSPWRACRRNWATRSIGVWPKTRACDSTPRKNWRTPWAPHSSRGGRHPGRYESS